MMNKIGRERGWSRMTRQSFEALRTLRGALVVGSPDEVIEKILYQHKIFGHQRFLLQMSIGAISHSKIMHAIELFGTKVAPIIRRETEQAPAPVASS
jgi:alkanesulfonate monooxygenase SsuD/methylene tetrahydromethanopterin reductase-like flavin-dependent oxidoreductase (luciferase family)